MLVCISILDIRGLTELYFDRKSNLPDGLASMTNLRSFVLDFGDLGDFPVGAYLGRLEDLTTNDCGFPLGLLAVPGSG